MEFIRWIISNPVEFVGILTSIVGTAALIAAATPTPTDDARVAKVQKVIKRIADVIGANWGNAKNDPYQ